MRLVLASASPRRRELLASLGVAFVCDPAEIDETVRAGERAVDYVARMAQEKSLGVLARHTRGDEIVLGADTSVVVDGDVLGKPENRLHAQQMLQRLSGRTHEVLSAVCVASHSARQSVVVTTSVAFVALTDQAIAAYLATEEPWDKAGAYGIQGLAGAFVRRIEGSYSNVVGLPLAETWEMLVAAGVSTRFEGAAWKGTVQASGRGSHLE